MFYQLSASSLCPYAKNTRMTWPLACPAWLGHPSWDCGWLWEEQSAPSSQCPGGSEVHRWKVKRVGGSVWHSNQLFPDLSSTANDGATRLSHVSVKPHVTSAVCFKMRFFLLHQLAIFCQDFGTLAHRFTSYRTTSQKLPGNSLDEIFQSIHMFLVHNHSEVINCMAESLNFAPAVAVHFV